MRRRLESVTAIGRKIGINDEQGYGVAVFLALIVVAVVVAGFFISSAIFAKPQGYNTIYLLDANNKAIEYPQDLAVNQNSTVYVTVENHNTTDESYQIQVKITKNLSSYPLDAVLPIQVFETSNIESGKSWSTPAIISQKEPGNYSVVFELWQHKNGGVEFANNYCILNINVT